MTLILNHCYTDIGVSHQYRKTHTGEIMDAREKINPNKIARTAGVLYLIVFALGIFGEFFIRQNLFVAGDISATASNLVTNDSLYRLGFVIDIIRQTALILLPLVLYKLLGPVNKNIAVVMAVFALIAVPIAMINLLIQQGVALLLTSPDSLAGFARDQLGAQVMFLQELDEYGNYIAQFLGFWVSLLGILVFKSHFIPKIIGILLIISGLGYLVDSLIFFLLPSLEITISQFTFWGEAIFALWLLIMGVKVDQWKKISFESP